MMKPGEALPASLSPIKNWERQMSYLTGVANQRPLLRITAQVLLAFCCAAPLVLAFSSLACGLVMFSYIFSHFFNHALGNVSYALMEKWLTFHIWWWRIPIVNVTLYAAAATH